MRLSETVLSGGRRQKVVIERRDNLGIEWWVMFDDGTVEVFDHASAAAKAVRARAKRGNKTMTVTTIEWRNVPEGWKPS